jgi:protein-S-isoprenylcysteine O-methyltransferase Ste14
MFAKVKRKKMDKVMDNPGVRIPPPLIYLLFILLGVALDQLVQVRITSNGAIPRLGGALVMLALLIMGWSLLQFRKAKTTVRPDKPASALITTGPFRFSRNPLYLAWSILYAAVGLWLNSAWVMALLIPTIVVVTFAVIVREERHLLKQFGEDYQYYRATVRRWL